MRYFVFVRGQFTITDEVIDAPEGTPWESVVIAGGYNALSTCWFGSPDSSPISIAAYPVDRKAEVRPKYDYLVALYIGFEINAVFVPTLPDLLSLLEQTVPLITAGMATEDREERWAEANSKREEVLFRRKG